MTGLYPHWWEGLRFDDPVRWWASGDTGKTTRDIVQLALLGPPGQFGTGFIPGYLIEHTTAKSGVPDAIETIWVRHVSGGVSQCQLKSYDQRREAYQGTAQHGIWNDEEPPFEIHAECLLRTMSTPDFPGGTILETFTPLQGMTDLIQDYFDHAERYVEEVD